MNMCLNPISAVSEKTDKELMVAVQRQDHFAFTALLNRHHEKIIGGLINQFGFPYDVIEDLFQEIWLRIWNCAHQYASKSDFSTWLYSIVRNLAIDRVRKLVRERSRYAPIDPELEDFFENQYVSNPSNNPSKLAGQQEETVLLLRRFEELSPAHREVFRLYEVEGLTYKKIAEKTGSSIGTVKSRLFYAKQQLQNKLSLDGIRSSN